MEVRCISESVLDLDLFSLSNNCYKKKDKIIHCTAILYRLEQGACRELGTCFENRFPAM